MNTREIGTHYEEAAAAYLENEGIKIIDRNVTCGKLGEIDLIGIDSNVPSVFATEGTGTESGEEAGILVFFEVKYRKNAASGHPEEAVDLKKQEKIRRCAQYYLAYRKNKMYVRFDVIAIQGEEITWYKNAF